MLYLTPLQLGTILHITSLVSQPYFSYVSQKEREEKKLFNSLLLLPLETKEVHVWLACETMIIHLYSGIISNHGIQVGRRSCCYRISRQTPLVPVCLHIMHACPLPI